MKHKIFFTFLIVITLAFTSKAQENDFSATLKKMETLNENVKKLKKQPNNDELREKTIKLVLSMKIEPPVPQEVDILKSKAVFAFKSATNKDDYKASAKAYQEASNYAPWVAELYYNLAVAQEAAEQPKDAISSYKFYLMAEPNTTKGEAILNKIGELHYTADKQEASSSKSFTGFSYGFSNPRGDFSDKSTSNLNAGFADPGTSVTIDVNDYKHVIGNSNKFTHGFAFQTEFATYKYDIPYLLFIDKTNQVTKNVSYILSYNESTSGKYYFVNLKFGWGMAFKANKYLTVDLLKAVYGAGMAISSFKSSVSSKNNVGLAFIPTIGSGIRLNLTENFGIALKAEYSIGDQKYWSNETAYAVKNPKIGYNTLNYCIGIILRQKAANSGVGKSRELNK